MEDQKKGVESLLSNLEIAVIHSILATAYTEVSKSLTEGVVPNPHKEGTLEHKLLQKVNESLESHVRKTKFFMAVKSAAEKLSPIVEIIMSVDEDIKTTVEQQS
jgi:hypothetical protein